MYVLPPKINRLGETSRSTYDELMIVVNFNNSTDLDVMFEDGAIVKHKCYDRFKNGKILNPNRLKNERLNMTNTNKNGLLMKIIDYRSYNDLDIQFEDGTIVKNRAYKEFKDGVVKNPNSRLIYGVGYIGECTVVYDKDCVQLNNKAYSMWHCMFERCYLRNNNTYKECYVCDDWHNFQNFKKWFYENYTEYGYGRMCLDKDILIKGNKKYSPDTCVVVDTRINSMFTKSDKTRGRYPIGVFYKKKNKKYAAQVSMCNEINKKQQKHIGLFDNPEEAFYAYKEEKEKYIKQVADEYKSKYINFPYKLYNAMYAWKVDILD